jgi:hypothetical protein
MIIAGACHCGSIRGSFETAKSPAELGVRACQCAFCRRHGALNITDPQGRFVIEGAADAIERYRFALKTADFLICRHCGVYAAAIIGEGDAIYSTANITGLRMAGFDSVEPQPIVYDAEDAGGRTDRRTTRWTPTTFTDPDLARSYFGPH